jgi:hypothetical protein
MDLCHFFDAQLRALGAKGFIQEYLKFCTPIVEINTYIWLVKYTLSSREYVNVKAVRTY